MPQPYAEAGDPAPVMTRVLGEAGVELEFEPGLFRAMFDERALETALASLLGAVAPAGARLVGDDDAVALRLEADAADLLDHVLVVTPEREIRPGLLLARTLFERQGGSLTAEGEHLIARLPRA